MALSWLRRRSTPKPKVSPCRTFRPQLEILEDRTTPSSAFALSGTSLLAFDIATPALTSTTPITGVVAGETLVGIDFRPLNGLLYGLGINHTADTGTLYTISTTTGAATIVGTASQIALVQADGTTAVDFQDPASNGYGVDFNPSADLLRVTTTGGTNFRVSPFTGAAQDGNFGGVVALPGTTPDGNVNGGTTTVQGAAYTNNFANNGNITTLYTLDAATDSLFIQTPPNSGTQTAGKLVTLGRTPLNFTGFTGFDIPTGVNAPSSNAAVTAGFAFAILDVGGQRGLYRINLVNAQATFIGTIGNGAPAVQGLAVKNDLSGTPVATGPTIRIVNSAAAVISTLTPFVGFAGSVVTAKGDLNGDGTEDVIAVAPVSGHVKVFDGVTGAEIRSFLAFQGFTGAVFAGRGDINNDGFDDIIVGASVNGHVKVFDGQTGALLRSFFAYAGFPGGVRVASGDIDNDGFDDIVTGATVNGHVKVFSGLTGAEIRSFLAYPGYPDGVFVAAGDVNGDGRVDIITAADVNGHVKAFSGVDNSNIRSFLAFPSYNGQTRVASRNLNAGAADDIIVATGTGQSFIRAVDGANLGVIFNLQINESGNLGTFVG